MALSPSNFDQEHAPKSTANFLAYVASGHYDNTIFHRIIPGFMVQGGGMEAGMKQKQTKAPIENEANNGLKITITPWPWPVRATPIQRPRSFSSTSLTTIF